MQSHPDPFQQALGLHQQGKLEEAARIYQTILKDHPQHADSLHLLGVIANQTGQYKHAIALIRQAIDIHPHNPVFYLNLVNALQAQGLQRESLLACNKAIALAPIFAEAHSLRGAALLALADYDSAIASFNQVIQLNPDDAHAFFCRGVALQSQGKFQSALESYAQTLRLWPDHAEAYCNSGSALLELGQTEAAIENFREAIRLSPDYVDAHYNLGLALNAAGTPEAAISCFERSLSIRPDFADAFTNLGNTQHTLGKLDAALANHDKAITIHPDFAEAWNNRGNTLSSLGHPEAALESYNKAITLNKNLAPAWNNRGMVLKALGQNEKALESFEQAIALNQAYAEAYCNRGSLLKDLGKFTEAIASHDKAIAINPAYAEAFYNRGNALQAEEDYCQALICYERAIELKADYIEAHYNSGVMLYAMGRIDEAAACYGRVLAINPAYAEAHWNMSHIQLLRGNFEEGWPLYEWRWKVDSRYQKQIPQPLWLGRESLAGKTILLHSEQGLGDTIQLCRYARLVADQGARVILETSPTLIPLLDGLPGIAQFIERDAPLPTFDLHCPLLSLPLAFATRLETIPTPSSPYLHADPVRIRFWQQRLGVQTRPRIGLVWSGNPNHLNDRNRSLPLSVLLSHLPEGFEYFSLQKELKPGERDLLRKRPDIRHLGDDIADFLDTAALCEIMDIVISVDTSIVHLAGALGRPAWVMLAFVPDWRWMLERSDSPWYPSLRLYRQPAFRNWDGLLDRIRQDLLALN